MAARSEGVLQAPAPGGRVFAATFTVLVFGVASGCGRSQSEVSSLVADQPQELRIVAVPGSRLDRWRVDNQEGVAAFVKGCHVAQIADSKCQEIQTDPSQDYSPFFRDSERHDVTRNGLPAADDDIVNGVDSAEVVFYVGHATTSRLTANKPKKLSVLVPHRQMLFGNGRIRYFLGCACQILAHGPEVPQQASPDDDFTRPDLYRRTAVAHRNAGRWWGGMEPEMRLICGGSSLLCGDSDPIAERFWSFNDRYPVADAFLLAAVDGKERIPVCLTHGDEDPKDSPLGTDLQFTAAANRKAKKGPFLHMLYPTIESERDDLTPEAADLIQAAASAQLPLLTALRVDQPRWLDENRWRPAPPDVEAAGGDRFPKDEYYKNPASGLISFSVPSAEPGSAQDTREILQQVGFLQDLDDGVTEENLVHKSEVKLHYQSWKRDGKAEVRNLPKETYHLYSRRLTLDEDASPLKHVGFIGWGDELLLSRRPGEDETRVTVLWREIHPTADGPYSIRGYEDAFKRARARLSEEFGEDERHYRLRKWQWGYLAENPGCRLSLMPLIYRFSFEARTTEGWRRFPPRILDVSGFRDLSIPDRTCLEE